MQSRSIEGFSWPRLRAGIWWFFALFLLGAYFKQIWGIFALGPIEWVRENQSLAVFLRPAWQALNGQFQWSLPAFGEAAMRTMAALWGASLIFASAQILGAALFKLFRLDIENSVDRFLFRTALGFGAWSYLSLGLAVLSLYRPMVLTWLVAAILAGGAIFFRSQVRGTWNARRDFDLGSRLWAGIRRERTWIAVSLLSISIAWIGALAPEIEYDALWYHLWLPKLWLAHGAPVDVVQEYISLYPLQWELIYGVAFSLGGTVAAKLIHFICLPLTAMVVFRLTQRFLPKASPWLAVAIFVSVPTVLWEATTAYVDLALAFFVGLTLYALLIYLNEHRTQFLVLAGLNLGLALAIKHLALLVWFLVTLGLFLHLWWQDRKVIEAFKAAFLLGITSLLLPLPWYVRSGLASGNPFFPNLYSLFGAFPPERWNEISAQGLASFEAHFGMARTPLNLALLPWNVTVHAASFGGALGPVFLLLLAAYFLRRPTGTASRLLVLVAGYVALWASPISSFQMRFLVPITPLLAILAADSFGRLSEFIQEARLEKRLLFGLMAGLLLLNLPPFISLHEPDRQGWDGWLTHVIAEIPMGVVTGHETENSYLTRKVPAYAAWQYINDHLPPDACILTFSGGDHYYSERKRIWSDSTIARGAVWGAQQGEEQQALDALRRLGVSYMLVDKRLQASLQPQSVAILQPSVLDRWFDPQYEDARFVLYRLLDS
jgi:hypothetical protein